MQLVGGKNAASKKFEYSEWVPGKGGECNAWRPIKSSWLIAVTDWHDEEKIMIEKQENPVIERLLDISNMCLETSY